MRTNYRYTILGLLFLATTINYIDRQIIGLIKPMLAVEFKWTEKDYADIVFRFQPDVRGGLYFIGQVY